MSAGGPRLGMVMGRPCLNRLELGRIPKRYVADYFTAHIVAAGQAREYLVAGHNAFPPVARSMAARSASWAMRSSGFMGLKMLSSLRR